ncbi:MAG: DUF2461 domain-containing protein [Gemmatimonadetes bacterium]|nr:DUF2461 domain-containing protein [Gemmatimonadota bacterium]
MAHASWFGPGALTFLRGLKKNNRKEWFEEHRDDYTREVLEPLRAVAGELDVRFAKLAPEFEANPKRSLFRIYRDVRFSKDKSPYKSHAALWVYHRAPGRGVGKEIDGGAGFYLHVEPGASMVAGGIWMPPRHSLAKLRDRLADDHHRVFRSIVTAPAFVKRFGGLNVGEAGVKLKRMPRGFAEDHPAADLLRFNSFTVSARYSDREILAPAMIDKAMKDFALILPLCRWLNSALGHKPAARR